MISKEKFVSIIKRLKATDETKNSIDDIIRKSRDAIESDFVYSAGIMVCHQDMVIDLLNEIFDCDDTLSWWIYDLEYGSKFEIGCMWYYEDDNKIEPDLSTPEKLYDYLAKEK